jgi:hypothetical protein
MARLPTWIFAPVLLAVGVVRIGVLPIGPEWVGWLRGAAESLPEPSQYLSSSVGPAVVMRVLGGPPSIIWWLLGAGIWLLVFAVPITILARRGVRGRLLAIGLAASPAFAVTVTMLGHYDLWIIAGSATLVLAKRAWVALLGALVAVLGNPEQALPSALAILLVALAWRNRSLALRSLVYLGLASCAVVLVAAWASAAGGPSRSGGYLSLLPLSVESFLGVWPLAIYAWLGPLWLAVLALILMLPPWRSRALALGGVVVVPALMSITTLDGTRVFVAVGTGALVALVALALQGPLREWSPPEAALAVGGAALIFMPSVIIDTAGGIRLPYSDWISQAKVRLP